jgi:chemotaxis receptor (MCP) glutamine deamidase CheD
MTDLKRSIGPAQLMMYGIGSTLSAGIYGVVRKIAKLLHLICSNLAGHRIAQPQARLGIPDDEIRNR